MFSDGQRRNVAFSWKLHIGIFWIFLDNYLFMRPENEDLATNFSERKDIDFCCAQIYDDISTLWLLIICNMQINYSAIFHKV